MSGKQGKKSLETEKNCIMSLNNENLILNIYGLNKTKLWHKRKLPGMKAEIKKT